MTGALVFWCLAYARAAATTLAFTNHGNVSHHSHIHAADFQTTVCSCTKARSAAVPGQLSQGRLTIHPAKFKGAAVGAAGPRTLRAHGSTAGCCRTAHRCLQHMTWSFAAGLEDLALMHLTVPPRSHTYFLTVINLCAACYKGCGVSDVLHMMRMRNHLTYALHGDARQLLLNCSNHLPTPKVTPSMQGLCAVCHQQH